MPYRAASNTRRRNMDGFLTEGELQAEIDIIQEQGKYI